MQDLNLGDYATIALAIMGMFYLVSKSFEFTVGLLFDRGWTKWKFSWSKNKEKYALDAMHAAFDLRPENIGKCKAFQLTHGYMLLIVQDELVDDLLQKTDELEEVCGKSSTTSPSSDSSPNQE